MNCYYDAGGGNSVASLACIPCFVGNIVNFGIGLAGVAAAFYLIFSGIRLISSKGNTEVASQAKKGITFALIGLVIVILAFTILRLSGTLFGIDLIPKC